MSLSLVELISQAQKIVYSDISDLFDSYAQESADLGLWGARIIEKLREYSLRQGKAIRPLLVAVGAAASRSVPISEALQDPKVRRLMMLVELTQDRIIMADDVADNDDFRREKPSMHKVWEAEIANDPQYQRLSPEQKLHVARTYTEITGIWFQMLNYSLFIKDGLFSLEEIAHFTRLLKKHSYELTAVGWFELFEQNFEELSEKTDEAAFLKGLEHITSEYTFVGPLLMGAFLGDRYSELEPMIKAYGRPAGVLFQITDDVLGLFGDPALTGKPVGNDIREGKKTLLVQYAYRKASAAEQEKLAGIVGKSDVTEAEIAWTRELIESTDALAEAKAKQQEIFAQCEDGLANWPDQESRIVLQTIASFVAERKK